ncbi:MAG: hypothetical protein HY289_15715 [Planctomycetes bacterium]|nr:hypothetical protein [Planctomycetota bacterium]
MFRQIVVIAAFLLVAGSAAAQPKTPTFLSISAALETSLETKIFQERIKLKVFLEALNDKLGNAVPAIVDKEAFTAEAADLPDPSEEDVVLPASPARMKAVQMLRIVLSQIGKGNATYVIRNGVIEITTAKRIAPEALMAYPVAAQFKKIPLEDAIETLCELSGATIIIDPRVGDKGRTPVTATFRNTIALEGAVRLLAEMADLQAETQENVLFITTKVKSDGKQAKADLQFKNRRLDLAVKDLAAWSGQTVLLDPAYMPTPTRFEAPGGVRRRLEAAASTEQPQIGSDPNEPKDAKITATFKSNVPARSVAEVIARQANLSVVELDGLLYITHPFMGMMGPGMMGGMGGMAIPLDPLKKQGQ